MDKELQNKINAPEFLAISGSRLYGSNRKDSDYDYRGFIIPPIDYIVGIKTFTDRMVGNDDHKVYSFKRFLELLTLADPQITELLFIPKDKIIHTSSIAEKILKNKDLFLSNIIYKRLVGFSNSEWRKAMAVKLVFDKLPKTEADLRLELINYATERGMPKEDKDDMLYYFDSVRGKQLVKSTNNLGAKRKSDYNKYGFCVSSASHAIRLLEELDELMLTGNITFPRPNATFLRDIKLGKISKDECEEAYNEILNKIEISKVKSILPNKPNKEEIDYIYKSVILEYLKNNL